MKNSRLLKRLSAALLALGSLSTSAAAAAVRPATPVAPAAAKHMLFKVRGPNGATVYLLGSVHLLSPEAGKLPAEVDSAFARAKTVAFETSIDSVQMRAQEMLLKARYAPGMSLKKSLSPTGLAKADSVVKMYGLNLDMLDQFKPWFVSVALTQMVMQKANFQSQYGVDVQLNERAKTANKNVVGLESVDFQLNLFDTIDPLDQERMITSNKGPAEAAAELAKIKDAWLAGDVAGLEALFKDTQDESPKMLDIMLNNRNASWIPKIDEMLKGKDDALIVVGAAHLVGKKGVLELLKAKGYTVEQL
jgi:uncharacterized protein YbaP (TraB family)